MLGTRHVFTGSLENKISRIGHYNPHRIHKTTEELKREYKISDTVEFPEQILKGNKEYHNTSRIILVKALPITEGTIDNLSYKKCPCDVHYDTGNQVTTFSEMGGDGLVIPSKGILSVKMEKREGKMETAHNSSMKVPYDFTHLIDSKKPRIMFLNCGSLASKQTNRENEGFEPKTLIEVQISPVGGGETKTGRSCMLMKNMRTQTNYRDDRKDYQKAHGLDSHLVKLYQGKKTVAGYEENQREETEKIVKYCREFSKKMLNDNSCKSASIYINSENGTVNDSCNAPEKQMVVPEEITNALRARRIYLHLVNTQGGKFQARCKFNSPEFFSNMLSEINFCIHNSLKGKNYTGISLASLFKGNSGLPDDFEYEPLNVQGSYDYLSGVGPMSPMTVNEIQNSLKISENSSKTTTEEAFASLPESNKGDCADHTPDSEVSDCLIRIIFDYIVDLNQDVCVSSGNMIDNKMVTHLRTMKIPVTPLKGCDVGYNTTWSGLKKITDTVESFFEEYPHMHEGTFNVNGDSHRSINGSGMSVVSVPVDCGGGDKLERDHEIVECFSSNKDHPKSTSEHDTMKAIAENKKNMTLFISIPDRKLSILVHLGDYHSGKKDFTKTFHRSLMKNVVVPLVSASKTQVHSGYEHDRNHHPYPDRSFHHYGKVHTGSSCFKPREIHWCEEETVILREMVKTCLVLNTQADETLCQEPPGPCDTKCTPKKAHFMTEKKTLSLCVPDLLEVFCKLPCRPSFKATVTKVRNRYGVGCYRGRHEGSKEKIHEYYLCCIDKGCGEREWVAYVLGECSTFYKVPFDVGYIKNRKKICPKPCGPPAPKERGLACDSLFEDELGLLIGCDTFFSPLVLAELRWFKKMAFLERNPKKQKMPGSSFVNNDGGGKQTGAIFLGDGYGSYDAPYPGQPTQYVDEYGVLRTVFFPEWFYLPGRYLRKRNFLRRKLGWGRRRGRGRFRGPYRRRSVFRGPRYASSRRPRYISPGLGLGAAAAGLGLGAIGVGLGLGSLGRGGRRGGRGGRRR